MSTTTKITIGVLVLAVIALAVGYFWPKPQLAGITNQYIEQYDSAVRYIGGYNSQLPIQTTSSIQGGSSVTTGDALVNGGTLNITTSNTATSTLVVGCIQFYATSTATAQKFQASTTPGVMYSQYGTCPNL